MTHPSIFQGIDLAYGCWRLTEDVPASVETRIKTALDHGMRLIDTADIYGFTDPQRGRIINGADSDGFGGAEAVLGDILRAQPSLRQDMLLTTKGGIRPPTPYNSQSDYLAAALENSLRRLGTDYVDLYQIHRPDLLTGFAQLAVTLEGFVRSGKVRALGVSNFTPAQIRALASHLKTPLVSHQPEISLWATEPFEDGTLDICQEMSLTPLAWSPLGGGTLLGKQPDIDMARTQAALRDMAEKYSCTAPQMALAFLQAHPSGIIPIIGTQTPARIIESAGAAQIKLSREDWYSLYVARRGNPMP